MTNPPRIQGRFVSGHHYNAKTQIKPGERRSKATEIQPGERRSVATEFCKGQSARNRLPVDTIRVRVETHTGLRRAWVKIAEPNVWKKRAVIVWESTHGSLPRGYVVHHKDRDSMNDREQNLVALTRREHAAEHRHEIEAARRSA